MKFSRASSMTVTSEWAMTLAERGSSVTAHLADHVTRAQRATSTVREPSMDVTTT